MKRTLFIVMMLFIAVNAFSQNWQTNFTKAKEIASRENKQIILVFQGSDWCGPCIKLSKEIWSAEAFTAYAEEHYVMLKADFPKKKVNALDAKQQEENNKLAEIYNKNGIFPFVVVLNQRGQVLGTTGYKHISPKEYIALLNSFIK